MAEVGCPNLRTQAQLDKEHCSALSPRIEEIRWPTPVPVDLVDHEILLLYARLGHIAADPRITILVAAG